jgi:hypothetical protein
LLEFWKWSESECYLFEVDDAFGDVVLDNGKIILNYLFMASNESKVVKTQDEFSDKKLITLRKNLKSCT